MQHCLSGWTNISMGAGSKMSRLDLRSSMEIRPHPGTVPSAQDDIQLVRTSRLEIHFFSLAFLRPSIHCSLTPVSVHKSLSHPSVCPPTTHPSVHLVIHPAISYPLIHLAVHCLLIYTSVQLSIRSSIHPSTHPSTR